MDKWQCKRCDYIYDAQLGDPDNGIEVGTTYEDLPKEWVCPECGAPKRRFEPYDEEQREEDDEELREEEE